MTLVANYISIRGAVMLLVMTIVTSECMVCLCMTVYVCVHVCMLTECDQVIFSGRETSGVVTSPYYPQPYPVNVRCIYYIDGLQDKQNLEKVKLTINDIDIPSAHSAPARLVLAFLSLSVCLSICPSICLCVCLCRQTYIQ